MALTKVSGDVLQQPIDVGIITATSITATTATFSGNVSIAGTLTYEDVTNIDSIGLVTARSGIHVTGGSVGIGTDNPLDILQVGAASTQAFYVFSDGRVSIGQDNPTGIFAARDNSGTSGFSQIIRAEKKGTSDTNVFRVDIDADTNEIQLIGTGAQASNINIVIGSNSAAYFKTDGNVGIGVTDPNENLEVAANSAHRISVRATDTTMSNTGDYGGFCWYTNDASNPNRKNWDIYQKASGSTGTTDLHINSFSTNDIVVLDSGGNIGIGTDNPDEKLEVYGGKIFIDGGGNRKITLDPGSNTTYDSRIDASHSLVFRSYVDSGAGVKTCTFDTNGDLDLTQGRNLKFASGNGIDFSTTADGSGTSSSELFDDYEEGTWTPTFYLNGILQSYNVNFDARYLKIGKLVYLEFWLGFGQYGQTNFPSGANTPFEIGGLPYTVNQTSKPGSLGNARTQNGLSANFSIGANTVQRICFWGTGGSFSNWSGVGKLQANQISSNTDVVVAGSYSYYN